MKPDLVKYVRLVKRLFVLFSVITIPAFMVCLVLAFEKMPVFYYLTPVVGVGYFIVYALYTMQVSMGLVLGIEVTDQVVHIKTKRKTFTYDVKEGCVAMKVTAKKFVGTFRTQDSEDKFVFYRHPPFMRWGAEQFTEDDIRAFYPDLDA